MLEVRRFVHDENIRKFRERLSQETDPNEIRRLTALIEREEELFQEAIRLLREQESSGSKKS